MTQPTQSPSWLAKPRRKQPTTTPPAQTPAKPLKQPKTPETPRFSGGLAKHDGSKPSQPAEKTGVGNHSDPKTTKGGPVAVLTDVEALADHLVAASIRPDAAALVRPDLPAILSAMIAGAHVPGPAGMGERANLFRLTGLPTDRPKDAGDGGKRQLLDVAARLERAAGMRAKVIDTLVGAETVTVDRPMPDEGPSDLGFGD